MYRYLILGVILLGLLSCETKEEDLVFSELRVLPDPDDEDQCWDVSETWDFEVELTNLEESDIEWDAYIGDFISEFPISADGVITPFDNIESQYVIIASYKEDFTVADTLYINATFCSCHYDMACDQFSDVGDDVTVTAIEEADMVFMEFKSEDSPDFGTLSFPIKYFPAEGETSNISLTQTAAEDGELWSLVYFYGSGSEFLTAPSNTDDNDVPIPGSSFLEIELQNQGSKVTGTVIGECVYSIPSNEESIMTSVKIVFVGGIFNPAEGAFGCE